MKKYIILKKYLCYIYAVFFAFNILFTQTLYAQKSKSDSLLALLSAEKTDTVRIKLLWKLGDVMSIYNTDSALLVSQQALLLSKRIHYIEGQSRSLGIMANTFSKMGNYPRALQSNIEKLQLEENRNMPRNLASVLMNIGTVYNLQEEYRKALEYYFKSDAVINSNKLGDLTYYIALNLGDTYNRLNINDSAFIYFDKSLQLAFKLNDGDFIGTSLTGIAQTNFKQKNYIASLTNFQSAISYLKEANDDDVLCEATLSLAKLYHEINNRDSAAYYAALSNAIAQKAGFTSRQLDAVTFLTTHYKEAKELDSAFRYMTFLKQLNDTINSRARIKEVQLISINEQLRQQEIEEQKKLAKKERGKQLQLLFIGIFIPGFFLLTLLLSRIKIHIKLVKVLGILSLLILFEYLTLLLHPYVLKLTNYTPVYEMLIFVSIAAFLIPTHHRIEHWVIHMLTRNHNVGKSKKIVIKTMKIKIKNPSG